MQTLSITFTNKPILQGQEFTKRRPFLKITCFRFFLSGVCTLLTDTNTNEQFIHYLTDDETDRFVNSDYFRRSRELSSGSGIFSPDGNGLLTAERIYKLQWMKTK